MSGISIGHSHPRPCLGNKTLRRCRTKGVGDNVIVIDVDSETSDNVVIIDIPESFPKRSEESHVPKKDKNWVFRNVLNIDVINIDDDDDDDDETPDSRSPLGATNVSLSARTPLKSAENFVHSTVKDSATPVRLSKCKRTYSGKASTSNHYGLDSDSECDLSVNDYPDCELVEDFSGNVQELWEKAVARRRKDTHNVRSGINGQGSTSSYINKDHQNADLNHLSKDAGVSDQEYSAHGKSKSQPECRPSVLVEQADARRRKDTHNVRSGIKGQGSTSSYINKDHQNAELNHLSKDAGVSDQEYSAHGKSKSQPEYRPSVLVEQADCLESSIPGSIVENKDGQLHMETGNSLSPVEACIGRESHKETDEYRKAMEKEYALREEAVRIEAEKAQNEKRAAKRKKAESMRLLDMERRQKQRLEEMRSIKKKDEDNMNMKDTIRAEIRNQLKKMEVECPNMASLLYSLGIKVGSWPNPSPQEVQGAYKRALLTFHPDRADRSDIRKLVEAEERFKLINRMKEKFPSF